MAQSVYAWQGTPIHLMLEDSVADAYNRLAATIARLDTLDVNTSVWSSEEELAAWNGVADIINKLCEMNGGTLNLTEADSISPFLMKVN